MILDKVLRSRSKTIIYALISLVLLMIIVVGVKFLMDLEQKHSKIPDDDLIGSDDDSLNGKIIYNNETYYEKRSLDVILVIGIDEDGAVKASGSYNNTDQADFYALILHDPNSGKCNVLYLNRDTMTNIPVLGVGGRNAGHIYAQLALSHTYGSGLEDSCENTVDAVSNLLFGITIDHYISLNMDAVGILNDYIGGVEVLIEDDFSSVAPELVMGESVTLKGEQALLFVRARSEMAEPTNIARMQRQQQYVSAFIEKFTASMNNGYTSFYSGAYNQVQDYMVTDMAVDELGEILTALSADETISFHSIEGEAVIGKEFMEFYPDEAKLFSLVKELFFIN